MEYEGTELEMERKSMRRERKKKRKERGRNRGVMESKLMKEKIYLNLGKTEGERGKGRVIDRMATHEQDLARRQSPHVGFLIRYMGQP